MNPARAATHLSCITLEGELPVQVNQLRTASFAPSPALRPFIQRFLVVEYTAGLNTKLLPGAGIVAAFRCKGECLINGAAVPNALVTGLWDTARVLTHSGRCANVIAMFTPTGAAAFLREPVTNLFNQTMPFDHQVRRTHLDLVEEQLAESQHDAERVLRLERFLIAELRRHEPDALVGAAVARIHRTCGSLRIDDLARNLGCSQSALERRFQRAVGTSPKKFAALVRLRHVVQLRQAGVTFTAIAHTAGYTDQAHFIKDFRRFAGASRGLLSIHDGLLLRRAEKSSKRRICTIPASPVAANIGSMRRSQLPQKHFNRPIWSVSVAALLALAAATNVHAQAASPIPPITQKGTQMKTFVIIFRQRPPEPTPEERQRTSGDVVAWAQQLNASGHKLQPHILTPEGAVRGEEGVVSLPHGEWPITALLFLEASDLDEATRIAQSHPALRNRAVVEIRPWNPPVRPVQP